MFGGVDEATSGVSGNREATVSKRAQVSTERRCGGQGGRGAFTLIELLVVIAIIALLIGILLPALGRARDSARNVLSQSNIRQITTAMMTYVGDYDDNFPPNVPPLNNNRYVDPDGKLGRRWFDVDVLGQYIPSSDGGDLGFVPPVGSNLRATIGGGVMQNPNHPEAGRSYAMNYWASSYVLFRRSGFGITSPVSSYVRPGDPSLSSGGSPVEQPFMINGRIGPAGVGFKASVDFASQVHVMGDSWAEYWKDQDLDGDFGAFATETIGSFGLPGERFGADATFEQKFNLFFYNNGARSPGNPEFDALTAFGAGRYPASYIPYYRHPQRSTKLFEVEGKANIGKADGSVEQFSPSDLFNGSTDRSTYKVLWSPRDQQVERAVLGMP